MKTLPQVPNGRFYKQPDGSVISEAEHLARSQSAAARTGKAPKASETKVNAGTASASPTDPKTTPETTPEAGE